MAKKKQYASPQVAPDGLSTMHKGGAAPSYDDVIESANARAEKRHAVKSPSDSEADSLFPGVGVDGVLDRAGIDNNGYIVKKGLEHGIGVMYNTLPPGMDIEDQENADIRTMPYKEVVDLSYPGDGYKR